MMNQVNDGHEANRFIRHQLPLVLFAVTLIGFNFLLNFFLRSDNPRPDLAQAAQNAVAAPSTTRVEGFQEILPVAGDIRASGWQVISGDWLTEDDALRQRGLADFDQTIVYSAETFETFALDASLRHLTNIGGGVVFNMQRTDSLAGSQLVRFEADGSAIYWGYFDADRQFTGQGFAPISVDPYQTQRLTIKSHATTYDIFLNDNIVIANVPLEWKSGHIGLAASQADVMFENVSVLPIDGVGTVPAEEQLLIAQAETISGEWVYQENVIRQLQNEATDFMTSLNVLGKNYLIEADINMGDADSPADNGAGFMFHMVDRDSRAGAKMVRFMNHGQQIVWGCFDDEGVFEGSGNLAVDVLPHETVNLALRVSSSSFDILVNETEVVSDVPLERNEGWIGLVAYRGEVSFSDVHLNIGEY